MYIRNSAGRKARRQAINRLTFIKYPIKIAADDGHNSVGENKEKENGFYMLYSHFSRKIT